MNGNGKRKRNIVIGSLVTIMFSAIACDNSQSKKNIENDSPPGQEFVNPGEKIKNAKDSVVNGDLQGSINGKKWTLRSGAVSFLRLPNNELYSGIIAGTAGETQKIVCDSEGYANLRIPGQYDGLIEVTLPAKEGTYSSKDENTNYSIKIYNSRKKPTIWEVNINKVTKSTISGYLKAEFDTSDNNQIEGQFSLEICTK